MATKKKKKHKALSRADRELINDRDELALKLRAAENSLYTAEENLSKCRLEKNALHDTVKQLTAENPLWWKPTSVRCGATIHSLAGDKGLTIFDVHPGQEVYQVERNAINGAERQLRDERMQWHPGACKAFAADGKLLFLLYPEQLSTIQRLIIASFLKPLVQEASDLLSAVNAPNTPKVM